jgi:hypothetical protein
MHAHLEVSEADGPQISRRQVLYGRTMLPSRIPHGALQERPPHTRHVTHHVSREGGWHNAERRSVRV